MDWERGGSLFYTGPVLFFFPFYSNHKITHHLWNQCNTYIYFSTYIFLFFFYNVWLLYEVVFKSKLYFTQLKNQSLQRGFLFYRQLSMKVIRCVMKDGAHNMERTKNGILLKQFPQWTSSGLIWNFKAVIVMASGLLGRLAGISRTFIAGLHTELQFKTRPKEPLHLVTGSAGFSKTISQSPSFKQWTFGDDAYFVANNRTADVIG